MLFKILKLVVHFDFPPCWKRLEYTVSPAENTPPPSKRGVLGMTLNYIWWGSSSGDMGSVEYPFITITSRSTPTQSC